MQPGTKREQQRLCIDSACPNFEWSPPLVNRTIDVLSVYSTLLLRKGQFERSCSWERIIMKLRIRPAIFFADLAILAILFSPIFIGRYQYATATPPRSVKTLPDFRARMDQDDIEYFKFERSNHEFYEARRLLPLFFTFRSGPCSYIFDSRGKLLEWTADNGNDRDWDVKWGQIGRQAVPYHAIQLK